MLRCFLKIGIRARAAEINWSKGVDCNFEEEEFQTSCFKSNGDHAERGFIAVTGGPGIGGWRRIRGNPDGERGNV